MFRFITFKNENMLKNITIFLLMTTLEEAIALKIYVLKGWSKVS
jgi:hypothetical protein